VPLNILLADDSVPAQNMGKKILVDAGYQVLTVSNGLEALRKIADAVPDIAILDIFMPGYTGLEICERLRASPVTASLPVILTVGKLEPYRPQDGEHVHSNAVIVKPFAAAELISAVRSLIGIPAAVEESHAEEIPSRTENAHDALTAAPSVPQFAGASQEPDEPLFAMGPSATQVQRDEPFFSKDGPESLVFNPDAEHTPFSASAIDLLPAASHAPVAADTSAFTEFDLEPEASHYSPAAVQVGSTVEQTPPAVPPAAIADAGQAASPSPAMATDAVIAPDPVAPSSSGAAELESSALDIPARDPLLEVFAPEPDESSRAIPSEALADHAEGDRNPQAPAPNPQDEARRLAFEELFNSTDPFPVEDSPVPENRTVLLPSMADLSKDHPFEVAPDSEIEPLVDDQPEFIAPEPDPYLMQEEEPPNAIGKIPDRDPRLEGDFESEMSEVTALPWQPETTFNAPGYSHPHAEEHIELKAASSIDAPAPETQDLVVESRAAAVEIPPPEYPAGLPQPASESSAVEAQLVPEVETHRELTAPLDAHTAETQNMAAETAEQSIPALVHGAEIVETASEVPAVEAQHAPEVETHSEPTAPLDAHAVESQNMAAETAEQSIPALVHGAEIVETASESTVARAQTVPEALPQVVHETALAQDLHHETKTEPAAEIPVQLQPEPTAPVPGMQAEPSASSPEVIRRSSEAERIHQAVERVFDRFKPLLVAAIVRELARHD
jgi:CheY-like chemotaxis protein